jgi:hypothetical protein
MMSKRKGAVILLLLALAVLLMANETFAVAGGSFNTGGGGSFFDPFLNPNASGTKVTGTMTLYWYPKGTLGTCKDGSNFEALYDFVYVMRLNETGKANYPFAGTMRNVCIAVDLDIQTTTVKDFITKTVVHSIFGPNKVGELKSISTNVVGPNDDNDPCCMDESESAVDFLMLDFVMAVH